MHSNLLNKHHDVSPVIKKFKAALRHEIENKDIIEFTESLEEDATLKSLESNLSEIEINFPKYSSPI